jgi:hypothetical protein
MRVFSLPQINKLAVFSAARLTCEVGYECYQKDQHSTVEVLTGPALHEVPLLVQQM